MAENDTHYNGISDISDNDAAAPLPELEEEKAVYPDDAANIPVAPLPEPGEGGPVYPGNNTNGAIGGNWEPLGTSWKQLGQQLPASYSH